MNFPQDDNQWQPLVEEDWDDFYDAYEVTPFGKLLAAAGAALILAGLGYLAWMAFQ